MNRVEKLKKAIADNCLPIWHGRVTGLPGQLSRIADVAHSSIRYAYTAAGVRSYIQEGNILVVDAQDLVGHFETARPGRKARR